MYNKTAMTLVTDLNILGPEINNFDFMSIACITTEEYQQRNIYNAAVLMPPTELLMHWADGDVGILEAEYPKYLAQNKDADDMIIALLAALTKKNIVIYIPKDEFEVYGPIFMNYMKINFGIIMNTPTTMFSFDQRFEPLLLCKFYMMDLLDYNTLMEVYPMVPLYKFVIPKLAEEMRPFNFPAPMEQYDSYFNGLIMNRNQQQPRPKIVLARRTL